MNKYTLIAVAVIAMVFGIALTNFLKGCGHNPANTQTIVVHDTTTVTRYERETKTDTVIKWYEKIVYVENKPTIIYQQKIDSIFIETIKYKDLMLKIEKKGNNLKIFAVNLYDSLIKEYNWADVGHDFTATAMTGNIFVKSKRFYWTGIEPYLNYSITGINTWKEGEYNIGFRTGIEYQNISLKPFLNYNANKRDARGGLELGYIIK